MKIVYIIPGSGGTFYCQNCLRDNILASAMRKAGHKVVVLPMYLPMFSDTEENPKDAPIFYGALNLYLKYRFPIFRKFPEEKLRIVHVGIDTSAYSDKKELPQTRAVGFISNITESLGFSILSEAFLKL